ncbi:Transcription initiation factor IIE subunit alpha [Aphelenchoides bicaudatus]|nr:Transcription initiation factor IIE subunit alpha [Aphelenchoides bicaudatus]
MDNAQTGSVVNEVPETLKRLILVLAKVFYGPHHYILMDYLQQNVCVKEDRLRDLLKFETRFLRQLLVTLKVDKFISERQIAEETDGRSRKITYYHVNYKGILNVTKYKIDHIRAKLETREQDNSRKASYVCTGCAKHFEAHDVGTIMNFELNEMICWNCNQKVVADRSSGPSEETRNLMASFNEDMAGIFSMLQQMDGIRFARNILEPAIVKTVDVPTEAKEPAQVLRLGERKFNAGEQTSRSAIYSNGITVSIGEAVEEQIEAKSAVPWLQHTTYDYDNQQATPITGFSSQDLFGDKLTNRNVSIDQSMEVDDVNDTGFSLDQLLNVSRTADIGQLLVEIEGGS